LYYHWFCTTNGQRYRFQHEDEGVTNLIFHPSVAEDIRIVVKSDIAEATEPKKKYNTQKRIAAKRNSCTACHKRRENIKRGAESVAQPPAFMDIFELQTDPTHIEPPSELDSESYYGNEMDNDFDYQD